MSCDRCAYYEDLIEKINEGLRARIVKLENERIRADDLARKSVDFNNRLQHVEQIARSMRSEPYTFDQRLSAVERAAAATRDRVVELHERQDKGFDNVKKDIEHIVKAITTHVHPVTYSAYCDSDHDHSLYKCIPPPKVTGKFRNDNVPLGGHAHD